MWELITFPYRLLQLVIFFSENILVFCPDAVFHFWDKIIKMQSLIEKHNLQFDFSTFHSQNALIYLHTRQMFHLLLHHHAFTTFKFDCICICLTFSQSYELWDNYNNAFYQNIQSQLISHQIINKEIFSFTRLSIDFLKC